MFLSAGFLFGAQIYVLRLTFYGLTPMSEIATFLQANIIPIYFLYGLAHFVTGFAVALESGRASQLRLSRALPFLAAFGITHAINEWIEMLSMISAEIPTVAREPMWAEILKTGWMALSFFFLFEFGVRLLMQLLPKSLRWLRWLPLTSVLVFLLGVLWIARLPDTNFAMRIALAETWGHCVIGLPGTVLAAVAMLAQRRSFLRENMPQFGSDLVGAALALAWYAVLDHFIGPDVPFFPFSVINKTTFVALFGIPVEVLRTIVIAALAYFVIRMMRVFEVEYTRRLESANRARFAAQEEATRELSVMFETCRILGTSLNLNQLLNDSITRIVSMLDPMIAGMIYIYDPGERALVVRASKLREETAPLKPSERGCGKQAAQRAFETRATAYATDAKTGTAMIAVPIFAQDEAIGALCLAHRAAFSNYPVMQTLARQIGIAIENAGLYAQVQEKEDLRGHLLERAVAAQEEERKRIARELHDETGQTLTALAVGLGGVEETIPKDPALAKRQIAELKLLSMNAIENLRQFVSDLRPALLDDMGLVSALRWFAQQYADRSKVHVDIEVLGAKRRLPSQVETVLFRIAQEGLNNVGRHARANTAMIRLEFADGSVLLTVEDNGRGFVVSEVMGTQSKRAWGLLGIQERIELVGGKFKIESEPGHGTKVMVEIPVNSEQ
ncbi:MAG: GAF domain-containing sensor histidine kinase [Chloroflexi bacterium]|nr:GAF domain-containing sensor histidine kinase [Chloroflexota bacterium]